MLGDVRQPAKIELTEAGERILDVISEAGGLKCARHRDAGHPQRGGRSATVQYDHLVATPSENIYVAPVIRSLLIASVELLRIRCVGSEWPVRL